MRSLLLVLSILFALAFAASCSSMQQVDLKGATMADSLREKDVLKTGAQLELSTTDGRQVKGKVASVSDTTLTMNNEQGEAVAVQLSDIKTLKTEQFDFARTAGGVVLTYAAINVIGALILIGALGGAVVF